MRLSTAQRNRLPSSAFAIPEWRWGPLVNASHVHNAASRLEHEHNVGRITGARYSEARRRIASAARKFGTSSIYRKNPTGSFWTSPQGIGLQAGVGTLLVAAIAWAYEQKPSTANLTVPVATALL